MIFKFPSNLNLCNILIFYDSMINEEHAAEMERSSFVIYRCFVQLMSCPDSSGKETIQIIHVMKN